jgi:hypothetical protein
VVGMGSGMTAGAVLRHTNILSLQTVEISPEVFEAAHAFTNLNDNVFANPRFKIAIEDAKSFLKTTDETFDIIVSEPSNPWMAGVPGVFTIEYYESCAAKLAETGVMCQWVQVYETSDRTMRTVIKTFSAVFPFVSVWRAQPGDLVLIGTMKPRKFDVEAFVERMRQPHITPDLARGRFSEPLALLSRQMVSAQNGAFIAKAEDVVHSDYYPVLDYMAQEGFFIGANANFEVVDETKSVRAQTLLGEYLAKHPLTAADLKRGAQAVVDLQFMDVGLTHSLISRWAAAETNSTLPLEMIERLLPTRPAALTEELRLLPKHAWLLENGKRDVAALHFYERALMRAYRAKRSIFYLPDSGPLQEVLALLVERDPQNARVFNCHLSELAWDRGDDTLAYRYGLAGLNPDTKTAGPFVFTLDQLAPRQALANLIETSLREGDLKQAKAMADLARVGKLLQEGEFYFYPLELACRKVDAAMEGMKTAAAK